MNFSNNQIIFILLIIILCVIIYCVFELNSEKYYNYNGDTNYNIILNTNKLTKLIYPYKLLDNDKLTYYSDENLPNHLKSIGNNNEFNSLFRNISEIVNYTKTVKNKPKLNDIETQHSNLLFKTQLADSSWSDPSTDINTNNEENLLLDYMMKYKVFMFLTVNNDNKFEIKLQHSNGNLLTSDVLSKNTFDSFDSLKEWWTKLDTEENKITILYSEIKDDVDYGFGFKKLYSDDEFEDLEDQYNYLIKHHGHKHTHPVHNHNHTTNSDNPHKIIWTKSDNVHDPHIHRAEVLNPFYTPFKTEAKIQANKLSN